MMKSFSPHFLEMSVIDSNWIQSTENGKRYFLANIISIRFFGNFDQRIFELNERDCKRLKEWNQNLRNSNQLKESNKDIIKHIKKVFKTPNDEYLSILQLLEVD